LPCFPSVQSKDPGVLFESYWSSGEICLSRTAQDLCYDSDRPLLKSLARDVSILGGTEAHRQAAALAAGAALAVLRLFVVSGHSEVRTWVRQIKERTWVKKAWSDALPRAVVERVWPLYHFITEGGDKARPAFIERESAIIGDVPKDLSARLAKLYDGQIAMLRGACEELIALIDHVCASNGHP